MLVLIYDIEKFHFIIIFNGAVIFLEIKAIAM